MPTLKQTFQGEQFIQQPLNAQLEYVRGISSAFRKLPLEEQQEYLNARVPRRRERYGIREQVSRSIEGLTQEPDVQTREWLHGLVLEEDKIRRGELAGTRMEGVASRAYRAANIAAQRAADVTLGAPVDLATAGENLVRRTLGKPEVRRDPFSKQLMDAFGGRYYEPETTADEIAERVGEYGGLGAAMAFTGGAAAGARSATAVAPRTALGKAAHRMLVEPYEQNAQAAFMAEMQAGAGAGLAQGIAEQFMPDQPVAQIVAPLLGGVIGGWRQARKLMPEPSPRPQPNVTEVRPAKELAAERGAVSPKEQSAHPAYWEDTDSKLSQAIREDRVAPIQLDEARAKGVLESMEEGTVLRMDEALSENIVKTMGDLLVLGKVRRDPSRLLRDQLMELLETERLSGLSPEIRQVLDANGVTQEQLAQAFGVDIRYGAQKLARLSHVQQRLNRAMREALTPEEQEALAAVGPDPRPMSFWRRLDNIRRGIMVTQPATAARNFATQIGRLSLDAIQKGIDHWIQSSFGPRPPQAHPVSAMEALTRTFLRAGKTKREMDEVLSAFPKQNDALFFRYSSDLERVGAGSGAMHAAEKSVQALNVMNRFQEYLIRRAVTAARLEETLAKRGQSLEKIIRENRIGELAEDEVADAVQHALDMTWASNFDTGSLADHFIKATLKLPGATLILPYPRFMANAIRFQYEFSPLPFLAHPKQQIAKIAAGDTEQIIKSTLGMGMFLTAYQMRRSKYAGDRWYEVRPNGLPGEKQIDIRPFNPFAAYFFLADVLARWQEGRQNTITTRDVVQGLFSTSMRAGAGLYVFDQLLDEATRLGSEKTTEILKGAAGTVGSGFLMPFQTLRDITSHFDESQRIIRDRRAARLTGPGRVMIPYGEEIVEALGGEKLPEVELPTRAATPMRERPLIRQATGLTYRSEKNPAEIELDRHGFTRSEIIPGTGDLDIDREVARLMGPVVEKRISQMVGTPRYQRARPAEQAEMLRNGVAAIRKAARNAARIRRGREIDIQKIVSSTPRRRQRMIEERTGIPFRKYVEQMADRLRQQQAQGGAR